MPGQRGPSVLLAVIALTLAGCLDVSRLNARCEWAGDSSMAAIDMRSAGDRRHLANDVRIAGENAVRFGDSAQARVGVTGSVRVRFECLDDLHAAIIAQHAVTAAEIQAAARMRDLWLDAALIYVPCGLLLYLAAAWPSRRLFRRSPPPGERWTVVLNVVWTGLVVSFIATMAAHLHSWNVDAARLRNFHLSFRAAYLPIGMFPWQAYLVALLIFALAAWREFQVARRRPAEEGRRRFVDGWRR